MARPRGCTPRGTWEARWLSIFVFFFFRLVFSEGILYSFYSGGHGVFFSGFRAYLGNNTANELSSKGGGRGLSFVTVLWALRGRRVRHYLTIFWQCVDCTVGDQSWVSMSFTICLFCHLLRPAVPSYPFRACVPPGRLWASCASAWAGFRGA